MPTPIHGYKPSRVTSRTLQLLRFPTSRWLQSKQGYNLILYSLTSQNFLVTPIGYKPSGVTSLNFIHSESLIFSVTPRAFLVTSPAGLQAGLYNCYVYPPAGDYSPNKVTTLSLYSLTSQNFSRDTIGYKPSGVTSLIFIHSESPIYSQ